MSSRSGLAVKLFALIGILGLGSFSIGPVKSQENQKPPFPEIRLSGMLNGEAVVRGVGPVIPLLAAYYGKKPSELVDLFRQDPNLWADPKGRLLYICDLDGPLPADPVLSSSSATIRQSDPYPLDQTFLLHSSPGSSRTVYLDFNGQTVSGTAWNANFNSGQPIVAAPFSLDSDSSRFGTSELIMIQNIWRRVAEDYAPFDVDVTTEEPTAEELIRASTSDTVFGNRVIITPTNYWYQNAGGVSYVGVFDDVGETYKTSWAFSNALANGEKYIAEACSHENGHSVGLHHEGTTSGTVYYQGQGNWAPIMGNSYYREVTQWARGEYTGANNTEDQLSVMTSNGLAYFLDDVGNAAAAATALPAGPGISGSGFIERNSDIDVFRFSAGAGPVSISVSPAPLSPNLDIGAEIRDVNWALVTRSSSSGLDASLSANVSAGTYFLVLSGTGWGNPLVDGYSNYASLGQYTFTGTMTAPASANPPVAYASAYPASGTAPLPVSFTGSGSGGSGSLTYSWDFGDGSAKSAVQNPSHTYAVAGNFTAFLTVTDSLGLSGTATVSIAAGAAPVALSAPANLQASTPKSKVNLRWTDTNASEAGVYVERKDPGGSFLKIGQAAANATSYGDATISRGVSYEYRVRVFGSDGSTSPYSGTVTVKVR